jgi:Protein of unknown function (DUF1091)
MAQGMFITNMTVKDNPGVSNVTFELVKVNNDQFINLNMTLLKPIGYQIMANFKVSKVEGKSIKRVIQAPKFNYCVLRRHGGIIPILSDFLRLIACHGNLVFECPAEQVTYSVRNFPVREVQTMSMMSGSYLILFELLDENVKSKPKLIIQYKVYFIKK